jgi:hypothetical protein
MLFLRVDMEMTTFPDGRGKSVVGTLSGDRFSMKRYRFQCPDKALELAALELRRIPEKRIVKPYAVLRPTRPPPLR